MRIIAGRFGGRDLGSVPEGVRPTSDRVRESLFSSLACVDGLRVLDLFAGTGALGFEALSRGAGHVVFVERSRRVVRCLRERAALLGLVEPEEVRILEAEAKKAIARLEREGRERFDLVFMDAPYAEGDRIGTLDALFSAGILNERARVVVEGPKRHPLPPLSGIEVLRERDYGDTKLTWLGSPSGGAVRAESRESIRGGDA